MGWPVGNAEGFSVGGVVGARLGGIVGMADGAIVGYGQQLVVLTISNCASHFALEPVLRLNATEVVSVKV